jgi:hypothetical protein
MRAQKLVERGLRPAADFSLPLLAIPRRMLQLRQQVEGDIRRLVICGIGA